jgi:hypothetical protein
VQSKDDALLDLPVVQARVHAPPDQQVTHPETGTSRTLFDCPRFQLTPSGPCVRLIVAPHPATSTNTPSMGVLRGTPVFELFLTTAPQGAFTAADVLGLSLHRGSFETVLADEDQEPHTDRWVSHAPWGQEWWQIFHQWVCKLRLELGQHLSPAAMRLTDFAEASVVQAASAREPAPRAEPAPMAEPAPFGPPQGAKAAQMGGFAGSAFVPPSDGTVCCPTGHSRFPHERRPEREGSLRIVSAARIGRCRPCLLRDQCLGSATTTTRPRRVSAVLWPLSASPPNTSSIVQKSALPSRDTSALAPFHPLLWGEWERCQIRRRWRRLFRTPTVSVTTPRCMSASDTLPSPGTTVLTRAQRSHARLAWDQRLARNARLSTAPPLQVTIHGLPASCAQSFGFSLIAASSLRNHA